MKKILIGLRAAVLVSTLTMSATIARGSTPSAPSSIVETQDDDDVLVFEVPSSGLEVLSASDTASKTVHLLNGDQIDIAVPSFLDDEPSALEKKIGEEAYVRMVLASEYQSTGVVPMTVRSSDDDSLQDKQIFVKISQLSSLHLVDGKSDDDGESFDDAVDPSPQVTHEAPAAKPEQTIMQKIAQFFAHFSASKIISRFLSVATTHLYTRDGHGHLHKRYMRGHQGYCYRAVKDALRRSGLVPRSFRGGGSAYMAKSDLAQVGFVNLLQNKEFTATLSKYPWAAPKGAVLVYKGGRNGHVEIKTTPAGEPGYVSITETKRPAYGMWPSQRHLVAVMVKKSLDQ